MAINKKERHDMILAAVRPPKGNQSPPSVSGHARNFLFPTLVLTARPASIFKMHALARFATALACSATALAQQCYFPDGDKVASDTACNPNALVSACCYDNQACLSNGLCVSDPHDPVKARLHRGTCTDASWKSGNCPRECLGKHAFPRLSHRVL